VICPYERQLAGLFVAGDSPQHADVPYPLGALWVRISRNYTQY